MNLEDRCPKNLLLYGIGCRCLQTGWGANGAHWIKTGESLGTMSRGHLLPKLISWLQSSFDCQTCLKPAWECLHDGGETGRVLEEDEAGDGNGEEDHFCETLWNYRYQNSGTRNILAFCIKNIRKYFLLLHCRQSTGREHSAHMWSICSSAAFPPDSGNTKLQNRKSVFLPFCKISALCTFVKADLKAWMTIRDPRGQKRFAQFGLVPPWELRSKR